MAEKQRHLKRPEHEVVSADFLASYPDLATCPDGEMWEIAFIGRSNVGKSSIINMITDSKDLAKTSQNPGKTRSINLFRIKSQTPKAEMVWDLVDLPGFGYAKFSRTERVKWRKRIRDFLEKRPKLLCTFFLIDVRHSMQEIDREWLQWIGQKGLPFFIIFTKADKLSKTALKAQLANLNASIGEMWEPLPETFVTSAEKKRGRDEILGRVFGLVQEVKKMAL
uniref:Probable GTP-binding protein EngB n=1 Tax=uncultured Flavobacteriia bacterium TaxID=212695 RepID=H6RFW8_9BACT|nr:GTP-binding protein EngB [uncultured bacterium]CCF99929.1 GTP-binding protein [uncultured Flavobacteriia bacterium]